MTPLDRMTEQVINSIMSVIELCYSQGVTTTWRDIFTFLRFPEESWANENDLDEKIIITSDEDLVMMKAMLKSKFLLKRHNL